MNTETKNELSPDLANEKDCQTILSVLGVFAKALSPFIKPNSENTTPITLLGTHADLKSRVLSAESYTKIKNELGQATLADRYLAKIANQTSTLEPDFHFCLWDNGVSQSDIFTNFARETKLEFPDLDYIGDEIETNQQFVAMIDADTLMSVRLMQINKDTAKSCILIELEQNSGKIFHIHLTQPPRTQTEVNQEKRVNVQGISGITQIPVSIIDNKFVLEENRRKYQLSDSRKITTLDLSSNQFPSNIDSLLATLSDPSIRPATLEKSLRNMRKIMTAITCSNTFKNNFCSLSVDTITQLMLHRIAANLEQFTTSFSAQQLDRYYQELLVMAAWDAELTIDFMRQSGLDLIFTGNKFEEIKVPVQDNNLSEINKFISICYTNSINLLHLKQSWDSSNSS